MFLAFSGKHWGCVEVDLIGLEPNAGNPEDQADSAIDSSAVVTPVVTFETDCPDLVALAELWERLPPAMRGAVRGMAEAAIGAPSAPRATSPTSPSSPTSRP